MDLYSILKYIAIIICIVTLLIAFFFLFFYKKSDKMMQKLAIYFLLSSIVECVATIMSTILRQNNLFLFHFFAAVEIFILGHFFFDFYEKLGKKIECNWFIYPLLALIIGNSIFLQPLNTFNSYGLTLGSTTVIGMSIYGFYLMLEKGNSLPFLEELKWLIACFLLLHCSSLMVLLFSNKILEFSNNTQITIWVSRSVLILSIKIVQCYQSYKIYSKIKASDVAKMPDTLSSAQ